MHGPIEKDIDKQTEQGQRDYAAFDKVLDLVRDAFLSLHKSFASEERWRWDTPVITFIWGNGKDINRNLNGHVLGGTRPNGLEVEANAWRDVRKGADLVRYWRNFPAGRIDSSLFTPEMVKELIEKAYQEVSSWTIDHLESRALLSSGDREIKQ